MDDQEVEKEGELWAGLRRLTTARIGLGRAGISLPTAAHLAFQCAHARARDAVHLPFDPATFAGQLTSRGHTTLCLGSQAGDRQRYLQRPDLGRRLAAQSVTLLERHRSAQHEAAEVTIVVADGLSALAVQTHALPFLEQLAPMLLREAWTLAPVCIVEQGRVAIGDEIGGLLGARMLVMLIGERPGLSSPDSMGLYFTYAPKPGLTDANRNCISNIRAEGLSYRAAADRLIYLMRESMRRQLSGVSLKDESTPVLVNAQSRVLE